ncbi:MAG TPA: carboxypeptidase regulatory-like domain-containing protein [Pyrinomonadaceae bacterium]|nr:carboxypeptidase regulatory-like domain-containing protein [Pyrinomonadaceae bacterium]
MGKAILATVLVLFCSAAAYACSCMSSGPPCQAFWQADAVFSGQVISINTESKADEYGTKLRVVRMFVKESYRGVDRPEVDVLTGWGGGDCGFGFQIGQEYLVYAYRRDTDKNLVTNICTRTRSLSKAQEDLNYFHTLDKAKPGSTVVGEIQRSRRTKEDGIDRVPMANVRVTVEGAEKSFEALSDEKGKFTISGIPAGTYKVKLHLPKGLTAGSNEQEIKLAEKGCASIYFGVESDGRLSGTVFDSAGQPIENAQIGIREFGKQKYRGYWNIVYSDKAGKYEISRIPPGRYFLEIRFDGMTSQNRPFPRIYYQNTTDPQQATLISIGDGQVIQQFDLYVPPVPREYTVEGVVVRADGTPASDARVTYMSTDPIIYSTKVDENGKFSFKAYEGIKISVQALVESGGKRVESSWVPVDGPGAKLRIVIKSN